MSRPPMPVEFGALRPLADRGRSRIRHADRQGVGCRLRGGSSQLRELARVYGEVVGVDLSRAFIDAADTCAVRGELSYFRKGTKARWAQR